MRTANFTLICLALTLPACTNYTPPLSGPTANLRFLTLPGNKTEIHALNEARCDSASDKTIALVGHAVRNETGQGHSVGMPLSENIAKANSSEITLRSGQAFAAQMKAVAAPGPRGTDWSYEKCRKRFILKPKEGVNYEAQLEQYDGGCTLNVFRLNHEAGTYVRRLAGAEVTHCR